MRAIFESSWNHLEQAEREMFMQLSVLRGGFTRQAAQTVAGANLRDLVTLANKSLLRRDPSSGRYEIHELLRLYAGERLEATGKADAARTAHCAYYTEFVGRRQAEIRGARQVETLNEIEADLENVRSAWNWAVRQKDYAAIDRASEGLYVFYEWLNRYDEGEELFRQAREGLAPEPSEAPHPVWGLTLLSWYDLRTEGRGLLEPHDIIKAQAEASLAAAKQQDDRRGMAYSLALLGAIEEDIGNRTKAISHYKQSLAHHPGIGDSFWVTIRVGLCCRRVGQIEEAIKFFQQSLDRGRETGDKVKIAWSLTNIGETVIVENGNADERLVHEVEKHWREANDLFRQIGAPVGFMWTNANLSWTALLKGNLEDAKTLAEEVLAIAAEIDYTKYGKWAAMGTLFNIAVLEGDYPRGKQLFMEWLSIKPSIQRAMKITAVYCGPAMMLSVLPAIASIQAHEGEKERGVELLSLACHHPASPPGLLEAWPYLAHMRSELENNLPSDDFEAAWARGKELDFDRVIEELGNSPKVVRQASL
jgi:tetratricopeptide (TPR) repeat protein